MFNKQKNTKIEPINEGQNLKALPSPAINFRLMTYLCYSGQVI